MSDAHTRSFLLSLLALPLLTGCLHGQSPVDGPKANRRVVVDKSKQMLMAYEGDKVVIQTKVSTGKWDKATPNGSFTAGSKETMHYSKLYKNAPMPYSTYITGNVFIHGFSVVPNYPASHGCIRVPMKGNMAKQVFEWIEPGTPVEIVGHWGS